VLQVAQPTQLDALVTRAKPQLILVGADSRPLAPELRALARLTAATLVAVLDLADEPTLAATLALGYDAALLKPVHITELEHLLAL
jgi:AmiR/NasT family two-component response regulator